MLTLDTLARMADRMPTELDAAAGGPPFRRPDVARTRRVTLPPVREELRRALSLFAFVVGTAVVVFTITGLVVSHGATVWAGEAPPTDALLTSAGWYAGWTALFIVPFAAYGLGRELLRYAAARAALGGEAWLDAAGWLCSEDGRTRVPLRG